MSNVKGRLLVFEGCDNVGKSTIAKHFAGELRRAKQAVSLLSFPGQEAGSVGKWVYDLHHDPDRQSINQTSLQLLHVAAHIDCIESEIRPLINQGHDVILDRYWWSTVVYGFTAGVEMRRLEQMVELEKTVWGDIEPHCVFFVRRAAAEKLSNSLLVEQYEQLCFAEQSRYAIVQLHNESDVQSAVGRAREELETIGNIAGEFTK